jgi:hypothetical protein
VQNSDIYFGGAWLSDARKVIEKVLLTKMGVLEADSTVVFLLVRFVLAGGSRGELID